MSDIAKAAQANVDYARAEQAHAMKMFPESKSIGEALNKWYATNSGRNLAAAYCKSHYEETQKRGALGLGRADGSTGGQERDDNSESRDMLANDLNDGDLDEGPEDDGESRDSRHPRSRGRSPKRTARTFAEGKRAPLNDIELTKLYRSFGK